jgi:hypothetical protein
VSPTSCLLGRNFPPQPPDRRQTPESFIEVAGECPQAVAAAALVNRLRVERLQPVAAMTCDHVLPAAKSEGIAVFLAVSSGLPR